MAAPEAAVAPGPVDVAVGEHDDSQRLLSVDSDNEVFLAVDGSGSCRRTFFRRRWARLSRVGGAAVLLVSALALVCTAPMARHRETPNAFKVALGVVGLAAAPGKPGPPGQHIRNKNSGMCLDWGAIIVTILNCNPGRGMQLWRYGTQDHRITAVDGRCLDGGGKFVHVWDCIGTKEPPLSQQWTLDPKTHQLKQPGQHGPVCLSATKSKIESGPCDVSSKEQVWEMLDAVPHASDTGDTKIFPTTVAPTPKAPTVTPKVNIVLPPTTTAKVPMPATTAAPAATVAPKMPAATPVPEDPSMYEAVQIAHYPGICLSLEDKIHMETCDYAKRGQHWTHDFATGQIRSHDNRCLDAGSPTLLEACGTLDPNQAWGINQDTGHIQSERGFCLDAWWPSRAGKSVTLRACERDDSNQQWNLKRMTRTGL